MGKTLVTGATGLVGGHVTAALVARGDDVRVTVRARSKPDNLAALDVERVLCDVLDRRAVRRALRGVDRVFHCAGLTSLGAGADAHFRVNVEGTRVVLSEALKAGVQRVVHTSSMAAIGPAPRGSTADETQLFRAGRHGLAYVNAKHEAESEALRLAAQGLPVVVVNLAHVLGTGGVYRSSTELVRRFLCRQIPAYVDGALCVVEASDAAAGALLADERGAVGERYLLGGRNYTLDRLFADLGRLSGVEPPAVKLPLPAAIALAKAGSAVGGFGLGPHGVHEAELRAMGLWWAFRSTKARRELGWTTGHHELALERTIAWYRERDGAGLARPGTRQPAALRLAGLAGRRVEGVAGWLR